MGSDEEEEPDLSLVSTYVPVLVAVFKATCLVVFAEMLAFAGVHSSVKLVSLCAILYLDYNRLRQAKFERASGYMFFFSIAIYMREQEPVACHSLFGVLSWVADIAWAVSASTWGALSCLGMKTCIPFHGIVLSTSLFCSAHVMGTCGAFSFVELLLRVLVHLLMCAIMFFGKRHIQNLDRNQYTKSIPFICSHVLIVSVYIVLPSFMICACVFFILTRRLRGTEACDRPPAVACRLTEAHACAEKRVEGKSEEQERLCMQLRAAMAQSDAV